MAFLTDSEISELLNAKVLVVEGVDPNDNAKDTSPIQAASLDLSIGEIFLPGRGKILPRLWNFFKCKLESGQAGSADAAVFPPSLHECCLNTGETAVIRTEEELALPANLAGIAFPPANISLKGLLMTNPGHIDPGYVGPLHSTVINMGRKPFWLKRGDRIMRVLFMHLDQDSSNPYNKRRPQPAVSPVTYELLEKLSHDFVNVTERATSISQDAVKQARFWATLIPVIVAIITVAGTVVGNIWLANQQTRNEINGLKDRLTKVESTLDVQKMDQRLTKLENTNNKNENSRQIGK